MTQPVNGIGQNEDAIFGLSREVVRDRFPDFVEASALTPRIVKDQDILPGSVEGVKDQFKIRPSRVFYRTTAENLSRIFFAEGIDDFW